MESQAFCLDCFDFLDHFGGVKSVNWLQGHVWFAATVESDGMDIRNGVNLRLIKLLNNEVKKTCTCFVSF